MFTGYKPIIHSLLLLLLIYFLWAVHHIHVISGFRLVFINGNEAIRSIQPTSSTRIPCISPQVQPNLIRRPTESNPKLNTSTYKVSKHIQVIKQTQPNLLPSLGSNCECIWKRTHWLWKFQKCEKNARKSPKNHTEIIA